MAADLARINKVCAIPRRPSALGPPMCVLVPQSRDLITFLVLTGLLLVVVEKKKEIKKSSNEPSTSLN